MTNTTIKRYGESFKIKVLREYESGCNIPELKKKFGITGTSTITKWVQKYAPEGLRHRLIRIQTAEEVNRRRQPPKNEFQG